MAACDDHQAPTEPVVPEEPVPHKEEPTPDEEPVPDPNPESRVLSSMRNIKSLLQI